MFSVFPGYWSGSGGRDESGSVQPAALHVLHRLGHCSGTGPDPGREVNPLLSI